MWSNSLAVFWLLALLNNVLLAATFLTLWVLVPEWFRYPSPWSGSTLAPTLAILVLSALAGTWLAWNGLTGPSATGPVTGKRLLAHALGSGAVAGFLFFALVLVVFYVPEYGLRALGGLMSVPPALLLGAVVGLAIGLADVVACRLLGLGGLDPVHQEEQ